jgi:two-component system sensor histidine kinase DegS
LDELGLTHALKQSLEELQADGLNCKFSISGTPFRLPSSMEIGVYRITQETLHNIRKHAMANKVNLRLQFLENRLTVEIRDDGKGFDLNQTLNSAISVGHMGILGMKQRAEMLGGNFSIQTNEGAGTKIIFSFSVPPRQEEK